MAYKELFLRGGIAKGKLFHSRHICFGEALEKAYELEQSSVYPRIIIPNEIVESAVSSNVEKDKHLSMYNTFDTELSDFCEIIKKDNDGFWYVDFMSRYDNFDDIEEYKYGLKRIKEICDSKLTKNYNDQF